jgi:hypothetical protein
LSFHKEQPVGITTATFVSGWGAGTTSIVSSILRELILLPGLATRADRRLARNAR